MANSVDFRADQIQVNKIIVTGSNVNSTNCLLIYGSGAMGTPLNQGVINSTVFPSGAVGRDTFFYVSGAIGAKGGINPAVSVFGGDLHVSGNFTVEGTTQITGAVNLANSLSASGQISTANNLLVQGHTQVTGSITSPKITGSIRYVNAASSYPFLVGGGNITIQYNGVGQWEISSSIQKINVAGYNRTNLTSPTVIGLAHFNPTEYPLFSNLAFTAVGMNMAGVSGGLDLYDQNTSTLIAQLTWSGNSTLTTGSFQTTTLSFPASAKSYELHFSQSGGVNGGTDYSTVGFVNFVLS